MCTLDVKGNAMNKDITKEQIMPSFKVAKISKNKNMLLDSLNTPWLDILHLGVKKEIPENYIFDTNEKNLLFLEQGSVRLDGVSYGGKTHFFYFLGSGCILRDIPLLSKNYHKHIFLTTFEPCTVYFFSLKNIQSPEFISKYPHLIYNLAEGLAKKASFLTSILTDMHESDPKVIFARYIQKLCKQHNSLVFNSNTYKKDMASDMGLHRNTLSRTIKFFQDEKIISTFSRTHIHVLNFDKLQKIAKN